MIGGWFSGRSLRGNGSQRRLLQLESLERRIVFSTSATGGSTDDTPVLVSDDSTSSTQSIVRVSTTQQLLQAVDNLKSNTTILIAPGTYQLTRTVHVREVNHVVIRGETGNRDDVVLLGDGMTNANTNAPTAILVRLADNVTIADLTIRNTFYHSISLNEGAERPRLVNLRLVDAGEQFIKANPDDLGGGVDGGIVERCLIEYTTTAPTYYTNGVDVHTGRDWSIRDNVFRNIRGPQGRTGRPGDPHLEP
jgi:hypothetical protein